MAIQARLFSISDVLLELRKTNPPELAVTVHGYAVSSGWTDPQLVPLEKKLAPDGILDLDFVATPPAQINMPVLTPETAELVWTNDVDRLIGVRVVSRTGDVIKLIVQDSGQTTTQPLGEETTQIAGEGLHPHFAAMAAGGGATTMATGEEGPPPISTMATGEETVFSTMMLGEEGGGQPPTHMLGEHGGGQGLSTFPPAEEQSTFAWRRSEAVLVEPQGWLTGRGAATTAPLIEETTQIAGEGQPPHITTELQAEEQGGGGTVFTTLVVGEEGGTTAPWFEEMMPGPVIPPTQAQATGLLGEHGGGQQHPTTLVVGEEGHGGTTAPLLEETTQMVGEGPHPTTTLLGEEGPFPPGTTAPLIEETTQVAGEAWQDPQDQNPLGRR
jgi:hypothetical protein